MKGTPYISPSLTESMISLITAPADKKEKSLTERQIAILTLASEGKGTMEIAEELGLTYASVKHHFDAIFRVMGVHSRAQALLKAARMGIIPGER